MKLKLTILALALCAINQTFGMGEAARLAMAKTVVVTAPFEPQTDALACTGLVDNVNKLVREYLFDPCEFLPAYSSITNENSKYLLENYNPAERQGYDIMDLNPNSTRYRPLFFKKDLTQQLSLTISHWDDGFHRYARLMHNHILLFRDSGTVELWNTHAKTLVRHIECCALSHTDARRLSLNTTEFFGMQPPSLAGYILKTNRAAQALWPRLPLPTLYALQRFILDMDNVPELSYGLGHFIGFLRVHKLPFIMQQYLASHYRLKINPAVFAELQTMSHKDFVRLQEVIESIDTAHLQQNIGSSRPAPAFKEITSDFKKLSATMQEYLQNYYIVTLKPQSACVIQ